MAAPPLASSARYVAAGLTRIYWVESIADVHAPTRSELDAGVDLTGEVAETVGWGVQPGYIDTTGLTSEWETNRPGRSTADGSALMLYADQAGADIRATLRPRAQGNVVILHGGDVLGHLMDVWPAEVASLSQVPDVAGDPATVAIEFARPAAPALGVPVP